jgi:hypothetical protein
VWASDEPEKQCPALAGYDHGALWHGRARPHRLDQAVANEDGRVRDDIVAVEEMDVPNDERMGASKVEVSRGRARRHARADAWRVGYAQTVC